MKFTFYGYPWAGGAPDPKDILDEFFPNRYQTVASDTGGSTSFTLEASEQEIMSFIMNVNYDVMIRSISDGKFIAFDGNGKGFRPR
ncbi:hypothetical protein UFOVP1290_233 [uncultured Caudovirales phage]|uniref:Uncharacterized protein n=1 Tax=uncultured Caudovirales phage TaxID=2100421 RepID=A0A6J5RH75_9CAUD|nr:hypothetical protein UFOVP1290_233 [uncultured Caudovirales phage]